MHRWYLGCCFVQNVLTNPIVILLDMASSWFFFCLVAFMTMLEQIRPPYVVGEFFFISILIFFYVYEVYVESYFVHVNL